MISIADTEVCFLAVPDKGEFHVTLAAESKRIAEQRFTPSEFATFVRGFRDPFSIGEATVTIGDRNFLRRLRKYLQRVWNAHENETMRISE